MAKTHFKKKKKSMWQRNIGGFFSKLWPIYLASSGQAEVKNKSLMINITTGPVGSGVVRLRQVLSVPFLLLARSLAAWGVRTPRLLEQRSKRLESLYEIRNTNSTD